MQKLLLKMSWENNVHKLIYQIKQQLLLTNAKKLGHAKPEVNV